MEAQDATSFTVCGSLDASILRGALRGRSCRKRSAGLHCYGQQSGLGARWTRATDEARASQPHFVAPIVTTHVMLVQQFRYDMAWQRDASGGSITSNYGASIGLGYMGSRLSKRLVDAGYSVSVYDRDVCKTDSAAAHGAAPAHDLQDLASGRDVILSCLADVATVERVYLGRSGVLEYAQPGSLIIEMSTVAPETSQKLHGASLGLPHDRLFDTLAKTAVVAPAHVGKIAAAKQDDYSPQFPVRLMRKDFALILSNSERLGVPMPVTREASKVMEREAAYGREEDVVTLMQQWADHDAERPPEQARVSPASTIRFVKFPIH
jgi:3-hydroxyisobutyrate dehydrogenase-like beta-hydroxyacid dehydrogenase